MINSTSGKFNQIPEDWRDFLGEELCLKADALLSSVEKLGCFYPCDAVFRAFHLCPVSTLKVVLVGQDPYHGDGEADGLAFSVKNGVKMPPSLRNVFKELKADIGVERQDTDLSDWANSGVLLINAILTVKPNQPASHAKVGWAEWTDAVLIKVSELNTGVIFLLWGEFAKKKASLLSSASSLVTGGHPSPLSANRGGFFGGRYFSKINAILEENELGSVRWVR